MTKKAKVKQTLITMKEYRHLEVPLTGKEKTELGLKLADAVQQVANAEADKKAVASSFKAKIEEHQSRANSAAATLSAGYEYRDVECEVTKDFDKKLLTSRRLDTFVIVEERPLKKDELQINITLETDEQETEEDSDLSTESEVSMKK